MTGSVTTGGILVDGLGVGDVGNTVLRDRQHLAEDGIVIVALTLEDDDHGGSRIVAGPDITSRGFVYVKEADVLMNEADVVVENELDKVLRTKAADANALRTCVKDALSDFFWKKTKRRPMVLPMIMRVDE